LIIDCETDILWGLPLVVSPTFVMGVLVPIQVTLWVIKMLQSFLRLFLLSISVFCINFAACYAVLPPVVALAA